MWLQGVTPELSVQITLARQGTGMLPSFCAPAHCCANTCVPPDLLSSKARHPDLSLERRR